MAGCRGVLQAPSGPGWRGPARLGEGARAAGALAVAVSRQQVAPFPAAAARPLGRGAAGGGVGARVCECVRAVAPPPPAPRSVPLACRGRAALSRVRAPPPHLRLLHFASSSQCLEPESPPARRGRILSGWNETPQPGGAAPGRGTRAGDGSGAGLGLSAGKRTTFRARGSPLPHGEEGATVDFLLRDTRASRVRTPTCLSGCGGSRGRAGERAGAEVSGGWAAGARAEVSRAGGAPRGARQPGRRDLANFCQPWGWGWRLARAG